MKGLIFQNSNHNFKSLRQTNQKKLVTRFHKIRDGLRNYNNRVQGISSKDSISPTSEILYIHSYCYTPAKEMNQPSVKYQLSG